MQTHSGAASDLDRCAERILEAVPRAMHAIRREMRSGATGRLTVPQTRALLYIGRRPGTNLGDLAVHLGVGPSTCSALVERLVRHALVERTADPVERRRIQLTATEGGMAVVARARAQTRAWLRDALSALDRDEVERLERAMDVLESVTAAASGPGPAR